MKFVKRFKSIAHFFFNFGVCKHGDICGIALTRRLYEKEKAKA